MTGAELICSMTDSLRSALTMRDPFTNNSLGFYGADVEIVVTARLYTGNGVQEFHATSPSEEIGEKPIHAGVKKIMKTVKYSVGHKGKNDDVNQPDYVPSA
jgi:hypothetical protein